MATIMDIMFSDWLQEQLSSNGISPAELARRSGVSRQAISNYINGLRARPDIETAKYLAKGLHLPIETVFHAAGILPRDGESLSDKAQQIMGMVKEADDSTLDVAISTLEALLKQQALRSNNVKQVK